MLRTNVIGHYNPSVRIIERQIFEKLFMAILFNLRVFGRNLLRGNHRRNTFCILFWCLAWGSNPGFTSNKPTQYLLDYGDLTGAVGDNRIWEVFWGLEKMLA